MLAVLLFFGIKYSKAFLISLFLRSNNCKKGNEKPQISEKRKNKPYHSLLWVRGLVGMDTHIHLCLDTAEHIKYTGITPDNNSGRELALCQRWDEAVLVVQFLDGEKDVKLKVKEYALEWNKYAQIPCRVDR